MTKAPRKRKDDDYWFAQTTSVHDQRCQRECKTVWLRAYCAAIESFSADKAAKIASKAVADFQKVFH